MSQRDERFPGATATGVILIADPKKLWSVIAVRGVLAILFGIIALTWPGITVLALALLFGAWALLDGVSLLINAFRQGRAHADWRDWVPSLLGGLLGIAAAVITVLLPVVTVVVLTILAAILFIGVGVAEIVLAVRLRKVIRGEVFMALAGLAGVIAGVLFLIWPLSGALAITVLLGAYALVSGVLLLAAAWRLRRVARSDDVTAPARAGARSARRPQPRTP
ncbi:MAG TPA: HdeD family acid-resistance protein [Pseudonocardiaceae bacterium]|nr:HdeD family acid-resistance protein [Pseudonocardiaceae bacterium]